MSFREAHVEHAVGLVENEEANLAQIYIAQRDVGDKATRSSDDDIGTHAEALQLLVVAVAVVAAIYGNAAHIPAGNSRSLASPGLSAGPARGLAT